MTSPPSVLRVIVPLGLTVMTAFGVIFYGFSVYLTDEAAGAEFSNSVLSLSYAGAILIGGLLAFPVGKLADRRGVRLIVLTGAISGWLGLTLFSLARDNWQVLLATWLFIGPATAMTFYEPAFVVVDRFFDHDRRPGALAMLMVLGGLAGALFIPGTERLIAAMGWRPATRALGALLLVVGVSTALLAIPRQRIRASLPLAAGRTHERLWEPRLVLFTVAILLTFGSLQSVILHRVARFEEAGFAVASVAAWAGLASLLSLPGRSLAPFLARRFNPAHVLAVFIGLTALSVSLMVDGTENWQLAGHFVVFGLAFGALIPLRAIVMSSWYSGERYGEIMGAQWSVVTVLAATFPALVGLAHDTVAGYSLPMAGVATLLAAAAAITLISDRVARSAEVSSKPV
jgi:MFS family permease